MRAMCAHTYGVCVCSHTKQFEITSSMPFLSACTNVCVCVSVCLDPTMYKYVILTKRHNLMDFLIYDHKTWRANIIQSVNNHHMCVQYTRVWTHICRIETLNRSSYAHKHTHRMHAEPLTQTAHLKQIKVPRITNQRKNIQICREELPACINRRLNAI